MHENVPDEHARLRWLERTLDELAARPIGAFDPKKQVRLALAVEALLEAVRDAVSDTCFRSRIEPAQGCTAVPGDLFPYLPFMFPTE